jgi:hypothetical protein
MKKVIDISELVKALNNDDDIYREINGKLHKIDKLDIYQSELILVISKIKKGEFYVNYEY